MLFIYLHKHKTFSALFYHIEFSFVHLLRCFVITHRIAFAVNRCVLVLWELVKGKNGAEEQFVDLSIS